MDTRTGRARLCVNPGLSPPDLGVVLLPAEGTAARGRPQEATGRVPGAQQGEGPRGSARSWCGAAQHPTHFRAQLTLMVAYRGPRSKASRAYVGWCLPQTYLRQSVRALKGPFLF